MKRYFTMKLQIETSKDGTFCGKNCKFLRNLNKQCDMFRKDRHDILEGTKTGDLKFRRHVLCVWAEKHGR